MKTFVTGSARVSFMESRRASTAHKQNRPAGPGNWLSVKYHKSCEKQRFPSIRDQLQACWAVLIAAVTPDSENR